MRLVFFFASDWMLIWYLHRRPVSFECEISPRFPEAHALLTQERELRVS